MTEPTTDAAATTSGATLEWAPAEPAPRRKRWGLRIGIPAAIACGALVTASLVLIAPGTAVAGVPVGFLTSGAAADAVSQRLSAMTVTLGDGGPTLTGADLGATVDASALADEAYSAHPLWNVTAWFDDPSEAAITLDPATAAAAIQKVDPNLYVAPTPAAVTFDGSAYVVTDAVPGEGVDLAALQTDLQTAFADGKTSLTVDIASTPVLSPVSTENAESAASALNSMLETAGFYVDDERTVPLDADVVAGWLTIAADSTGEFTTSVDSAAVQAAVDSLTTDIDQKAANGTVVVNSSGTVLRTVTRGQDGRVLGDVSSLGSSFSDLLAAGDGKLELPVEVTAHKTTELERLLEVDLSEQRLYLKENGKTVDSWLISSGRAGAETITGHYRIGWKTPSQTMRGTSRDTGTVYEQPDVPWVMYFNGNQAFHGAYWHNNFGNVMSAGCVNMPPAKAKMIYEWSPEGVDVWIHS